MSLLHLYFLQLASILANLDDLKTVVLPSDRQLQFLDLHRCPGHVCRRRLVSLVVLF